MGASVTKFIKLVITTADTINVSGLTADDGAIVWWLFAAAVVSCNDERMCANGYQCYPPEKDCDEKADCLDRSDEWNCLCELTFYCEHKPYLSTVAGEVSGQSPPPPQKLQE